MHSLLIFLKAHEKWLVVPSCERRKIHSLSCRPHYSPEHHTVRWISSRRRRLPGTVCFIINPCWLLSLNTFLSFRPANGEFTVELAVNRAFTTFSYNGVNVANFGDGSDHKEFDAWRKAGNMTTCITEPNSAYLSLQLEAIFNLWPFQSIRKISLWPRGPSLPSHTKYAALSCIESWLILDSRKLQTLQKIISLYSQCYQSEASFQ